MAKKPGKRRPQREPAGTDADASADAPPDAPRAKGAPPSEGEPKAGPRAKTASKPKPASAKRPGSKKAALKKTAAKTSPKRDAASNERDPNGEEIARERRPRPPRSVADASPPAPRSAPRQTPWWLLAVVLAVVGIVVYQRTIDASPTEVVTPIVDRGDAGPARLRVEVIHRYAHATDAFTQGLLWYEGHLYESTGQLRQSSLRKVDLESGRVLQRRAMSDTVFAEGLARVDDRLVQLSWTSGEASVYRLDDFEPLRTFAYEGEGWGLCFDGEHLVMSDGSDRLTFRDPETFEPVRQVRVAERGDAVPYLNELECVDGVIWANIWQTDRIIRIDPSSGRVTGTVDASGLLSHDERWGADVLNGIAWIPERHHFVITGKYWPHLFEVDFVEDGP